MRCAVDTSPFILDNNRKIKHCNLRGDTHIISQHFNREYEMHEFPYFVPKEELEYNIDYAKSMVEEKWIWSRWREDITRGHWTRNKPQAERIAAHGGNILEICVGPDGGHFPATLMVDYNANIMINDLCPTVVMEWHSLLQRLDSPPPNVEYAAFNVCDIPLADNCLDVVSGKAAIINVEGSRDKALKEIYRVLKPGGLFVFDFNFITEAFYNQMPRDARDIIKTKYPYLFWDTLGVFDELGFSQVETIHCDDWNNANDESTLADLCRDLGISLTFSTFYRYCVK